MLKRIKKPRKIMVKNSINNKIFKKKRSKKKRKKEMLKNKNHKYLIVLKAYSNTMSR